MITVLIVFCTMFLADFLLLAFLLPIWADKGVRLYRSEKAVSTNILEALLFRIEHLDTKGIVIGESLYFRSTFNIVKLYSVVGLLFLFKGKVEQKDGKITNELFLNNITPLMGLLILSIFFFLPIDLLGYFFLSILLLVAFFAIRGQISLAKTIDRQILEIESGESDPSLESSREDEK